MKKYEVIRKVAISLLTLIMCSCNVRNSSKIDDEQRYLYIEVSGDNASGSYRTKIDTTEIIANNDSSAYLIAYKKICISQKASELTANELKKVSGGTMGNYESIHSFQLLNEKNELVKRYVVPDSVLAKIEEEIFSIKIED